MGDQKAAKENLADVEFDFPQDMQKKVNQGIGDEMTIGKQMDDMLTASEVSSFLHIHPNTLRLWDAKGIIKCYRITPRGDRRFKLQDIDQFLTEMNTQNQQ